MRIASPSATESAADAPWMGRDPYDALAGHRIPLWLKTSARPRQILIQLRKRCPVDLGALLGIQPFTMAKTAGCLIDAEARLAAVADDSRPARERLDSLIAVLRSADGNVGSGSYGYEFDVQTRWAYYPARTPNIIATFFVGRGLGEAGLALCDDRVVDDAAASADFIMSSLLRDGDDGTTFFAYTPLTDRIVHNANLLGAGLVAAMGVLRSRTEWVDTALVAAQVSLAAQRPDGSWPYGEGEDLGWSDNFHTAYNLDGLLLLYVATGDQAVLAALRRGVTRWVEDFFGPNGEPKYYPRKPYPYDIHSAGTAVDVATRLGTWGFDTATLAQRVASWTAANLVEHRTGHTYYQKWRWFTDRRHFVRWGDAHWALGQASLVLLGAGCHAPLEAAVAAQSGVIPLG